MSYDARPEFDLQGLVNEYGLGGVRSVRKPQGGAVNENWIVRTNTILTPETLTKVMAAR